MIEKNELVSQKKKKALPTIILVLALLVVFYLIFGFVAIQPIGAIPDGITLMVVRAGTQIKFFDSPDAMCLRSMDGVSLLCRMAAMSAVSENANIVLRLPFFKYVYLASTNGATFDK